MFDAHCFCQVLGDAANEPKDIGDVDDLSTELTAADLEGIIVGAPTWNTGADEGRSGTAWDNVMDQIKGKRG
jgi:flavodoxin I